VDMTYEVTYQETFLRDTVAWRFETEYRNERNLDQTRTWGLHVAYRQAIGPGWRIGGILNANRKLHPEIPTYEVHSRTPRDDIIIVEPIPGDPGHSWAYNVGAGISKTMGPRGLRSTFGMDLVFEPAWSHTWAETDTVVTTATGGTIPTGGRTVENWFAFSNVIARFGVTQRVDQVAFQAGLDVNLIDYGLDQRDHVLGTVRHQDERWTEWTPTWGFVVTAGRVDMRYQGAYLIGTEHFLNPNAPHRARSGIDVLAAPSQPVNRTIPTVVTHRVTIAVAVF
jgi:hypothetical protein